MQSGRDRDEALVRRQLALGLSRAEDRGVHDTPQLVPGPVLGLVAGRYFSKVLNVQGKLSRRAGKTSSRSPPRGERALAARRGGERKE